MSEQEATEQGLQLVPKWLPVAAAIGSIVFGTGSAFVASSLTNQYQDKRLDILETRYERIESRLGIIERNITRVATKLGVQEDSK